MIKSIAVKVIITVLVFVFALSLMFSSVSKAGLSIPDTCAFNSITISNCMDCCVGRFLSALDECSNFTGSDRGACIRDESDNSSICRAECVDVHAGPPPQTGP